MSTSAAVISERVINRVMIRIIPAMIALHILNFLDRVNVSFAQKTMVQDLNLNSAIYGLAGGIFFIGYFIFEIPSNLIMQRVGARLWMARIMITWGIISSCMMFIRGEKSFYFLRLLLGFAEAGFAPGVLLYLTFWIPGPQRARAVAWWLTATALSGVIGSPLAGMLLKLNGCSLLGHPLAGWQWLFLIEGLPTVVAGFLVLWLLPDGPEQARFLNNEERRWLSDHMAHERMQRQLQGHTTLLQGLANPRVWILALIYGLIMLAFQTFQLFLPALVQESTGMDNPMYLGLLTALPFMAAVIAMVLVGRHSDHRNERHIHTAIVAAVGCLAIVLSVATYSPWIVLPLLCLAAAGIWSTLGPFWAIPPAFLSGTAAAAGIALVNSIGNLFGGFLGPSLMGWLKNRTHSYAPGLWIAAGSLLLCAILILAIKSDKVQQKA